MLKNHFALKRNILHISIMIANFIKLKILFFFLFFNLWCHCVYGQEVSDYTLEASIKIKSIGKTTRDVFQIYRELGANPQEVAVPFVFFTFLGYPNYPAIVSESNVCIFVYGSHPDCKRKYIVATKIVQDSNIQKILERFGCNIEINSGWTFFTQKKEDFNLIKDKQAILAYANERGNNDIEITVKPSIIDCTRLIEDKNLKNALNSIDKAQLFLNVSDNQIDINSDFFYKKEGFDFSDWLVKISNKPGIITKILSKNKNEVKANSLIERKELNNLCNRLRDHINSIGANTNYL